MEGRGESEHSIPILIHLQPTERVPHAFPTPKVTPTLTRSRKTLSSNGIRDRVTVVQCVKKVVPFQYGRGILK